MPPSLSPLLGYNTNVRHKGKVFHVQTEDSGVRYGHVITHLFVDGGRILKSLKSSYAESVGSDDQCEIVRALMKRQHKAMLMALRDGRFDRLADGVDPARVVGPASGPKVPVGKPKLQSIPPRALASAKAHAASPKAPPVAPRWPAEIPAAHRAGPPPLPDRQAAGKAARGDGEPAGALAAPRVAPELLPRPGAAFGPSHASSPQATARAEGAAGRPSGSERRLVPSRPASAFGHAKPYNGKSIFGEDASTDKSLDDVILSYLALDADPDEEA